LDAGLPITGVRIDMHTISADASSCLQDVGVMAEKANYRLRIDSLIIYISRLHGKRETGVKKTPDFITVMPIGIIRLRFRRAEIFTKYSKFYSTILVVPLVDLRIVPVLGKVGLLRWLVNQL
jgi:hypothetical protein